MKLLLSLLMLTSSLFAQQAINVLLVFDDLNTTSVTADLTALGVELAWKYTQQPVTKPNLIRIKLDSNLKVQADMLQKAVEKHKPVGMIGAVTSNVALIISEIAERNKIVFITPFATHPKVTSGKKYTFRTCFSDDYQVRTLGRYIYQVQGLRRGVVIYNQNQSYALGVRDTFEHSFLSLKNTKLEKLAIDNEKSITPQFIEQLKLLNPEFVLLPSYQTEAAAILSLLMSKLSEKVRYFGTDSWGGGRLFSQILENRLQNQQAFYVQHWSESYESKKNNLLKKTLASDSVPSNLRFTGTAMNAPIAMGYETGTVFLAAVSKIRQPNQISSNLLKEVLVSENFEGLTGTFNLKKENTPERGLFIYRITSNGEKLERIYK